MNNLIKQLKDNEKPFCKMSPEMQAKMLEMSRTDFDCLMLHGQWLRCNAMTDEGEQFLAGYTYRLRPDYTDEPEIVECEITWHATYHVWGYFSPLDDGYVVVESARSCHGFRLIGFKFKDGTVMGSPVKYSVPGITSHGYYASHEDLKTGQALEHHACTVLFRRKKQE